MFGDRKIQYKVLNINHRNQVLELVSSLHSLVSKYLSISKGIRIYPDQKVERWALKNNSVATSVH